MVDRDGCTVGASILDSIRALEPRWQLNTWAALGLTTVMLVRDPRRAVLVGCFAVVLLRIAQGIILWVTLWTTGTALADAGMEASKTVLVVFDNMAVANIILPLLIMPMALFCLHTMVRLVMFERASYLFT